MKPSNRSSNNRDFKKKLSRNGQYISEWNNAATIMLVCALNFDKAPCQTTQLLQLLRVFIWCNETVIVMSLRSGITFITFNNECHFKAICDLRSFSILFIKCRLQLPKQYYNTNLHIKPTIATYIFFICQWINILKEEKRTSRQQCRFNWQTERFHFHWFYFGLQMYRTYEQTKGNNIEM